MFKNYHNDEKKIENAQIMFDLFKGREKFYGKRTSGNYHPVYIDKKQKIGVPIRPENFIDHINGECELLIYQLRENGTCHFFAIDFDKEHSFGDALLLKKELERIGLFAYVCRSTRKGFHVYVFFSDEIQSYYLTSLARFLFDETGIMDRFLQMELNRLPEVFPKQLKYENSNSIGFGIKPPLHGTSMKNGQCCWVDDANQLIGGIGGSEEQWHYTKAIKKNSLASLEEVFHKYEIIPEKIIVNDRTGVKWPIQNEGVFYEDRGLSVTLTDNLDFNNVVNGCSAMKRHWQQSFSDIGHMNMRAIVSFAINTRNGRKMLSEKCTKPDLTEQQIKDAEKNGLRPWSCKKLQEFGFCQIGLDPQKCSGSYGTKNDYCLDKKQSRKKVDDHWVVDESSVFKEPSPIRYAYNKHFSSYEEMRHIIDMAVESKSKTKNIENHEIMEGLLDLSFKEREELKKRMLTEQLITKKELKRLESNIIKEKKEQAMKEAQEDENSVVYNGKIYSCTKDGYCISCLAKDEIVERFITNFLIEINEEINFISECSDNDALLKGRVLIKNQSYLFMIAKKDWGSNIHLAKAIADSAGCRAIISSKDMDHFRISVNYFSMRNMKMKQKIMDHGFEHYNAPSIYRSGNISISLDEVKNDFEIELDLSGCDQAKNLELKMISDDDFKASMNCVLKELLTIHPPQIAFTALAHTLQASIQLCFFPFHKAPILWFVGITGCGKSGFALDLQCFYGNFSTFINFTSTNNGIGKIMTFFKDALLVVDDFKKSLVNDNVKTIFQNAFDRTVRSKLRRDGKSGEAAKCRGLLLVTGEDIPESEASAISRMILIEFADVLNYDDVLREKFKKIDESKHLFSGITTKFIHWCLKNVTKDRMTFEFREIESKLIAGNEGMINAPRIAQSLSANYLTWTLFTAFLVDCTMILDSEKNQMDAVHFDNIMKLMNSDVIAKKRTLFYAHLANFSSNSKGLL